MIHDRIAPFGDEWRQTGRLAAILVNTRMTRSADSKWFEETDFMPMPKPLPEPLPEEPTAGPQDIPLARLAHNLLGGE